MGADDGGGLNRRTFLAWLGGLGAAALLVIEGTTSAVGHQMTRLRRLIGLSDDVPAPRVPRRDPQVPFPRIPQPQTLSDLIVPTKTAVEHNLESTEGIRVYQGSGITTGHLKEQSKEVFCATSDTLGALNEYEEGKTIDQIFNESGFPFTSLPLRSQSIMRQNVINARRSIREAYVGKSGTDTNEEAAFLVAVREGVCLF